MKTLAEYKSLLEAKEISARELTEDFLAKIAKAKALNAYVEVCADKALQQADEADKRIAKGQGRALEGIPLGIKDLFCTKGIKTTAASRILENFIPEYESSVTQNLLDEGAVFLGKLNLDEFAMGSSNKTSAWGEVINPWKEKGGEKNGALSPGGSSGGSAAAVSAGLCAAALGTDTGGSVRQPAALTGTVGLKPSYGRCSRWGIIAFASSLDQAGTLTRSVEDAALLLNVMAGSDAKDATSSTRATPDFTKALQDNRKLKIGIAREYQTESSPMLEQAKDWFRAEGAELCEVSLPHTKYALPTYYIIAPAEASSNLARYDGVRYGTRVAQASLTDMYNETRARGFGDEVKRRILIGTYVLSAGYYDAYYLKAQKVRKLIADEFAKVFEKVDVLLTPTTTQPAFALDKDYDPIEMYGNDVFTVPASLAGLPAISVPAGLSPEGLPLGLQLIAPAFQEEVLLCAAQRLEQAANFTAEPNNWWQGDA